LDKDKIIELILKIEHLTLRLEQTERENRILRKENQELKERLSRYEHPKNSGNSSIPPSKDENRPKRNTSFEKTGQYIENGFKCIVDEHKPCYWLWE
jgi:regulator of replication initiation timing